MRACPVLLVCACLLALPAAGLAQPVAADAAQEDGVTRLVFAIEYAIRSGDDAALRALARPDANRGRLSEFALSMTQTKVSEATVKERDRAPLSNGGQRLLLEILTVTAAEGRVWTWRVDTLPGQPGDPWMIADVQRLTVITGLFRLSLDTSLEWDVHNAVINAPDLTLTMASGYAFAARVPDGTTGIVLIGRGHVEFSPEPEAERGQVRIFSGEDALRTSFSSVFVRMTPAEFTARINETALQPRPVDPVHVRHALQVFDTQMPRSFQIDLNDLSTAQWSLIPADGDLVAEITTGKFGALTYARATAEPEDISFFDRRHRHNIAVYTSSAKLAARGRFFSEDDRLDYEVTHYDIDMSYSPERLWVDGVAKLTVHTQASLSGTVTIRLADPLVVREVMSPQFGRLVHLRVVGQNNVLVGLPGTIPEGADFDLVITYGGRLGAQRVDREAIAVQEPQQVEQVSIPIEPQWIYSNRSYWYPQAVVTSYSTAKVAIAVPGEFDVIATGTPQGRPTIVPPAPGQRPGKRFVFESAQPVRYLAFVVSRFQSTAPVTVNLMDDSVPLTLVVAANPRQTGRVRGFSERTTDILKFYGTLLADAPYDTFTLAITEGDLPGGHSPACFAILTQPLPSTPFVWSNDPVSFQNYPSFFLAHEVAHQWWGQAIGWKNYHEQWLSEGFAQYFAAMYADKERGHDTFDGVIRQMRRWAIDMSPQGPVYLGYRLGHIRSDTRVFRALVYNKGAMVLHMLRRFMGDEAFFSGLREFYATWRFKKAGTDDFRVAMEKAAGGRSLERFFDRWIYGSGIPIVHAEWTVQGTQLHLRLVQEGAQKGDQKADIYDLPVTVTVTYKDGTSEDVIVTLTEQTTERTLPLKGEVRVVEFNRDGAALAEFEK